MKTIKHSLITGIFLLVALISTAQRYEDFPAFDPKTEKFSTIKTRIENYLSQRMLEEYGTEFPAPDQVNENEYIHIYRWLRETEAHLDENGFIQNYSKRNFDAYEEAKRAFQKKNGGNSIDASTSGAWNNINTSTNANATGVNPRWSHGRIQCLALDPFNTNIIYAGSFMGGLFKSTNGGTNWSNISNGIPEPSVSAVAVNPSNSNNIILFSGVAGNNFVTNMPTNSIGAFITYDGGNNWFSTSLQWTQSQNIVAYDVKFAPTSNNIVVAATNNGIYRSTDYGANWTLVQSGIFFDIEFKPSSATCYAGGPTDIWTSPDNGLNWTIKSNSSYLNGKPTGAVIVDLAVTPANSNYVYALFQGDSISCQVLLSTNSGSTWSRQSLVSNIGGYTMKYQAGYGYGIAVSPTATNVVYIGDAEIYKSTTSGSTWSIVASFYSGNPATNVHEDMHDILTRGASEVITANDGGVSRSTDAGATWSFLSTNLNTAGYYGFGGFASNSGLFVGGTWDNGHFKLNGNDLTHLTCCDQGDGMIDPANSNTFYASSIYFGSPLWKTTDGGNTFNEISASVGCGCADTLKGAPFSSEKVMQVNPLKASTIYSMYRDFYVSYNKGANWTRRIIGGVPTQAFAQGTNDTTRFYAVKGNTIIASANSGVSWPATYSHPYSEKIWEITVNPSNANEFYFVSMGYNATNHVWKGTWTGSGAITVTNLSSGLPNVPCYKVVYQNTSSPGIYVGTDIGVFFRSSISGTWEMFNGGLPAVRVMDMEINYATQVISIATYGRGIWQSPLYSGCPSFFNHGNFSFTIFGTTYYYPYPYILGTEYFEASNDIHSSVAISGGVGTEVTYNAGNYILLTDSFSVAYGSAFNAYIQGCTLPKPVLSLPGEYVGPVSDLNAPINNTTPNYGDDFHLSLIPNPANDFVSINFSIADDANVNLKLFTIEGRLVQMIKNNELTSAGYYKTPFNISTLDNGIYYVRMECNGKGSVARLVVTH